MTQQNSAWGYRSNSSTVGLADVALPPLAAGEILVKNQAIGINPVDWKFIHANPLAWQDGHIPGVDGAGTVVALGEGVDASWLNQAVAYHAALKLNGSFAQYTVLKAERVMRLPNGMSFAMAASLPCPMLTAWQAVEKIPAKAGRKVLIVGLGAVNKLLVQMCKQRGFSVDVISKSLSEQQAAELDIECVFRSTDKIEQAYFAIFDAVSGANAASLVPLLQANGHIICIQDRVPEPVDPGFTRTISYHEIALGALHDYGDSQAWHELMQNGEAFMAQIQQGTILCEPPVEFSFAQMPEALTHSETSKQKTVVMV